MATKYFPVGYGRTYDSSKNYTEQQLRDLATTPTGEYNEGIYNTIKSFEQEKTGTPATGVTPSINVAGQDSNPYQGSSGGKGSPSINISTPSINIPTPNLDQDLTKVNAATVQEAVVDAGSAVQAQVIESGGAGQQALIDAASATQTNAIIVGDYLTGGQSNPALEQEASNITKGVEGSIATETKGLESSIQTEVKGYEATVDKEVKGLEASLAKEVKGIEQIPEDYANWNIDFAQKFDQSLDKDEDTYSSTTTPMPSANLDAKGFTGNDDPFADIETSTTKADKLTEEERLRRIRRLMLNRYGREDTILTGAKDPLNRRRYASAL